MTGGVCKDTEYLLHIHALKLTLGSTDYDFWFECVPVIIDVIIKWI